MNLTEAMIVRRTFIAPGHRHRRCVAFHCQPFATTNSISSMRLPSSVIVTAPRCPAGPITAHRKSTSLNRKEICGATCADAIGPATLAYRQASAGIPGFGSHFSLDMRRGRTRLFSNFCGYGSENESCFDPAMIIEVNA
ncbi:hypothetical protein V1286_007631 [Bradyrhizobium algeriense]|uniref:Uncharacterized protein n=1 Tax=Bradyrhizobium algeriense TaxID=634784 RepID=A0ABU8BNG7_9BRAD